MDRCAFAYALLRDLRGGMRSAFLVPPQKPAVADLAACDTTKEPSRQVCNVRKEISEGNSDSGCRLGGGNSG